MLYEEIKGIKRIVNSVSNKLETSIKNCGQYDELALKREALDIIKKFNSNLQK